MTEVEAVDWVITNYPEEVKSHKKFRFGSSWFGYFFGQAMEHGAGKLNAKLVNDELRRRLDED